MPTRLASRLCFPTIGILFLIGAIAPTAARTLIVALGASSTAGKFVGPNETYPAQLAAMLNAEGQNVEIVNAGINGDTSLGMLARLDADVPNGARVVILQTGTNDAGEGGHDRNIAEIERRLKARSIKIVPLRTSMMSDLRKDHALADGHHLTPDGYRILASRLLLLVERAMGR